jgi:hypothetical protein
MFDIQVGKMLIKKGTYIKKADRNRQEELKETEGMPIRRVC